MNVSATYVCPIRGLAECKAPEPQRLGQAAGIAKSLGLEKLLIPVLEACLLGGIKAKVLYLDGIVQALDRVGDAGISAWLVAACHRILGVVWPAPYIVTPIQDSRGDPLFLDGRIRHLRPFHWWSDPFMVQERIHRFRETVSVVSGHPALSGWILMDRDFEWARPDVQTADFVMKSFIAEIREKDEGKSFYLGTGWQELLHPEIVLELAKDVDGIRMAGLEKEAPGLDRYMSPETGVLQAAYMGTLGQWLFKKPVEVEVGWELREKLEDYDTWLEAGKKLASQGLAGASWLNLCDPEPGLCADPPWVIHHGLDKAALLDQTLNPKHWVEDWLNEIREAESLEETYDFIDLSREEYLADPDMHLPRLWHHFINSR